MSRRLGKTIGLALALIVLIAGSLTFLNCEAEDDYDYRWKQNPAPTEPESNPYFEERDYYQAEELDFARIQYYHDTLREVGIWVVFGTGIFVLSDYDYKVDWIR